VSALLDGLLLAYLTWAGFLAAMSLRWAWYRLSLPVKVLAVPLVLVAFALDLVFNLVTTVLFLDLPQEATFSQRMGRYKGDATWRTPIARWICANLLDPFQIGGHCRA